MPQLSRWYSRLLLTALFSCLLVSAGLRAQSVGLVLSGGGANGLAHVGVLKALEAHGIPIDYITGSSMGSIVGGLYVAGYSPSEIESMLSSEEFLRDIQGEFNEEGVFFLKVPAPDASWVQLKIAPDQPLINSLPTNVISPYALDINMLDVFGGANAVSGENFDSLLVPFRCVATNVRKKEVKLFRSGQLNAAIRASSTYPFYYKAVFTEGELLYDGGLLNNFPVDVMISEFNPDIIIGSNVSYNYDAPDPSDLVSQIKNMLVSLTDYSLKGKRGILIDPTLPANAFDFTDPQSIIVAGYHSTLAKMDSIQEIVTRRIDTLQLQQRRASFNARKPKIIFDEVEIRGLTAHQGKYIRQSLLKRDSIIAYSTLRPRFLRLFSEPQIKYVYPGLRFKPSTQRYKLTLDVEKEKDFFVKFGGNFSSKPINTGYVSVKYNYLREGAYFAESSFYFGKYYGSVQLSTRMQSAWRVPFYLELFGTLNRWDYFKSRATFFEASRPSFIVQDEKFAGMNIGMPLKYKSRLHLDIKRFEQRCNYYLTEEFLPTDTADLTRFIGSSAALVLERNTLNRKQYASKGTHLKLQARYINGHEYNQPGSTAINDSLSIRHQDWFSFILRYDNYFKTLKNLVFGFHAHGVWNTAYVFSNYKSSLIFSPAFQPIPESRTLFLENYRANKFIGAGLSGILNFSRNIDLRAEAHIFQPVNKLEETSLQGTATGKLFAEQHHILSTALVYHSPLGPLSLSLNYYERAASQLSFLLNFGYIIFNRTVNE